MCNYIRLILLFMLAMIFGTCRVTAAKTLNFSCIEETPDIEISRMVLAEAYRKLGIEIQIQRMPGLRSLIYANEGLTDGELFRAEGIEQDYVNLVRIKVPINTVDVVVVTKDVSFEVSDWQSLKPYHIGVQSGITFIESNISKIEGLKVARVKSSSQLLRMLENDRIDVVIAPRVSTILSLADLKLNNINILEPPLQILPLYHYLNKKHQSLVDELEDVLRRMEVEGEIQRIRDEYVLSIISE